MIDELDRREEGMRALARIMAETYRKGKTFAGVKEPIVDDGQVVGKSECDPKTNRVNYTETISTDLLRGRSRRHPI